MQSDDRSRWRSFPGIPTPLRLGSGSWPPWRHCWGLASSPSAARSEARDHRGGSVADTVAQTVATTVVPTTDAIILMTAEVVDGDTITMSDGSTVRLIGIDAPERGQCGFDEASAVLAELITGQSITLVPCARDDVDRYGRLLRYVEVNGVDADLKMIESGWAIARYDGRDGYGTHPRQDAYVQADDVTTSLNSCTAVVDPIAAPPAAVYYQNCTEVRVLPARPHSTRRSRMAEQVRWR